MAKILVIEDQVPLLEEIVDSLRYEGYEVVSAGDGVAGVQLAREQLPDLIISDIMMPEMDGYGVLAQVKVDPALSAIPIIFLTARSDIPSLQQALREGADGYLTKPFTTSELLSAIRMRLEQIYPDE